MVGVRGFEPPATASRTQCSTRLSYTPMVSAMQCMGGEGVHFIAHAKERKPLF
jgi:hypothetical protein